MNVVTGDNVSMMPYVAVMVVALVVIVGLVIYRKRKNK